MIDWINLICPQPEKIDEISAKYLIDRDDILDALDIDELSRTATSDNYDMTVIRIPLKKSETEYKAQPVGIYVPKARDTVITACLNESEVFGRVTRWKSSLDSPEFFILSMLGYSALIYTKVLKELDRETTAIQQKLEESATNTYLITLFSLEKSLTYLTMAIKSNQILLKKLKTKAAFKVASLDDLMEDTCIDTEQALSMAETNSGILTGMMDAYASCINNNLNVRMKTWTLISVALMIPTLITSAVGMNVKWPKSFEDSLWAGPLIITGSLLLGGIAWFIFTKRK